MRTKRGPDDDLLIDDFDRLDWSRAQVGRRSRRAGEKTEVFIDGAVAYQLRLIPSNKVLARFDSTLAAWPAIIATIEGGRLPRTLAFDALLSDGTAELVSAGPRIEWWARYNNGEPNPYSDAWAPPTTRSARGAG